MQKFHLSVGLFAVIVCLGMSSSAQAATLNNGDIVAIGNNGTPSPSIWQIDPSTGTRTVISSGGLLFAPREVVVSGLQNIYTIDPGATVQSIIHVNAETGTQSVFHSFNDLVIGEDIARPPLYTGLVRETSGSFIVSDSGNNILYRVSADGSTRNILSSGGDFDRIKGLGLDPDTGNIYVANYGHSYGYGYADGKIIRVDKDTGAQSTVVSGGLLRDPEDVVVGNDGSLYISDSSNPSGNSGQIVQYDFSTQTQTQIAFGGQLLNSIGITVENTGNLLTAHGRSGESTPGRITRSVTDPADPNNNDEIVSTYNGFYPAYLTIVAVPEPTTALMLAPVATWAMTRRRKRPM